MRALVQRVTYATVSVSGETIGEIGVGVVALIGVTHDDTTTQAKKLADKIANLRIFEDDEAKMNLSVLDIGGDVLAVSQFTLYGDTRKGRRPAYTEAARPDIAEPLVDEVVAQLRNFGLSVPTGRFGADMQIEMCNNGPVTLSIEV